jgi:putative copper resistance protein D
MTSRALHLAAGAVLVALVAFRWLVLRPARAGDASMPVLARFQLKLDRLFLGAAGVVILSDLGIVAAVAATMSGQSLGESLNLEIWRTVLFQTQFGAVTCVRGVLAAGLIAAAAARLFRPSSWLDFTGGILAVAVDVSFAWTGHAAATGGVPGDSHLAIDATHLFLAAIWPGMLVPLALFLRVTAQDDTLQPLVRRVTLRFAQISLGAVLLLAASGAANAVLMLHRPWDLVSTTYGEILLFKIALFLLVVSMAGYIRGRVLPSLSRHASDPAQTRVRLHQVRTVVGLEVALAAAIIIMTAVLGMTPPR